MQADSLATRLASRANTSAMTRQLNVEAARMGGDDNTLWQFASSMASSVTIRYCRNEAPPAPIELLECDLHDLWHAYYHAAMNISHGSPNQDRLAVQILQAREQGVLTRQLDVNKNERNEEGEVGPSEAVTSDGRIWTDLPFLVQDMTDFWVRDCAMMSAEQRLNIAAFLAKLASLGLANDGLSGIALITLRDALETARPLGQLGDQQEEDLHRQAGHLSVATLLPAVNSWLFASGSKLIKLSDKCWNNCPPSVGQLGNLMQSGVTSAVQDAGYSPQRWLFWLRRLDEIAYDARQAGKESLANYVERMMDNMLLLVDDIDTSVRRALNNAGDMVRYKPIAQLLGEPVGELVG